MPHSNQPRANPTPSEPTIHPPQRVYPRRSERRPDRPDDSVEIAALYLLESIYHHGNVATAPPLPEGFSAVSELTGLSLASYIVRATHSVSHAQRSGSDIRLGPDDKAYFNVFRKNPEESNAIVLQRILSEHRAFMKATSHAITNQGEPSLHWRENLRELEQRERECERLRLAATTGS